ncbi:MAG: hypothetical protein EPO32_03195 [Anaerolineae bacterium]|nr:MAG: hypothetical protein EPO32_03195 [Anaerolineae bacterium]
MPWLQSATQAVAPPADGPRTEVSPTEPPLAIQPSAIAEGQGQPLSGSQYIDDYRFVDDFSSEALGWPVFDDGVTILGYEPDETYSIQITRPDFLDWAYVPADFIVYEISFDVWAAPGNNDGTFGVMCQFQDPDNYYFVEFDLGAGQYQIGHIQNSFVSTLTDPGWAYSSELNGATSVNRIGIGCYLDYVSLYINDQWVNEVSIAAPFDSPAPAAFFIHTIDTADSDGYKVYIDNVEAWQPAQ